MVQIYVLKDPRTLEVRYVGATSQKLSRRLTGHLWDTKLKKANSYKINWIKELQKLGLKPLIETIEITDNWVEREKFWYDFYKSEKLTNSRDGGGGVFKKDTNSIERSSQAKFKPIDQYTIDGTFLKTWPCIRDAELFYSGNTKGTIKTCVQGGCKSSLGFRWVYTGQSIVGLAIPKRPLIVKCNDGTEKSFRSISAACKYYGLGLTALHRYVPENNIITEDIVQTVLRNTQKLRKE